MGFNRILTKHQGLRHVAQSTQSLGLHEIPQPATTVADQRCRLSRGWPWLTPEATAMFTCRNSRTVMFLTLLAISFTFIFHSLLHFIFYPSTV